ncbi:TPA: hypothetical protein ACFNMI_001585 [Neisseria bacilliformis]
MENNAMNIRFAALLSAALLALAACETKVSNPQAEAAASSAAPAAEAAAPPAEAAPQTLTSRDNAVSVSVSGNFQDQSGNAALLPEGATAEEVTLLQRDDDADITLSVTDLGKPAKSAKDYYAGLKSALEAGGLANLKVGAATENRMDYSFSYPDGGGENCIAIYHPENLYTVCAASATAAAPQLADTLKDVKLLKKAM